MGLRPAATIGLCLGVIACQSGLGGTTTEQPSSARLEYVTQFRNIDAAGKGRITIDQATAYYSGLFAQLDRNGDGFLNEQELEPLIPVMNAISGKELLFKLDRNSDNKISRPEFLVITNWLFQLSKSTNDMTLADVEKGLPPAKPSRAESSTAAPPPMKGR